jgi:dynactin complex subunit
LLDALAKERAGFEAMKIHMSNMQENEKSKIINQFNLRCSIKDDELEKERNKLEQVEAELESLRVAAEEEEDLHRSRIRVAIGSEMEVRTAAKELSQTLRMQRTWQSKELPKPTKL